MGPSPPRVVCSAEPSGLASRAAGPSARSVPGAGAPGASKLTLAKRGPYKSLGGHFNRTGLMRNRLSSSRRAPGFTLIEILVVALLIAILSAIGLISVRSFMTRNQLRIVIGETNQIATGLSLARDDLGFYPKINFLLYGENQIGLGLGEIDALSNPIHPDFAVYGNDVANLTSRIVQGWAGPYIGMSPGRRGTGGPTVVTMRMPGVADNPATPQNDADQQYPGDVWFQPYCVYIMNIDENGLVSFNTNDRRRQDGVTEPEFWQEHGNFFNAVVSYGPNQVPGGQNPPANANLPDRAAQESARLYEVIDIRNRLYEALEPAEYNTANRINGYFAIVDEDSDDLVRQF